MRSLCMCRNVRVDMLACLRNSRRGTHLWFACTHASMCSHGQVCASVALRSVRDTHGFGALALMATCTQRPGSDTMHAHSF